MKQGMMIFLSSLAIVYGGRANNVQISNVSTVVTASTTQVEFDISWDNSWRLSTGPGNYDAAWVFLKYNVGGAWQHLALTGLNNSIGAGFTLTVTSDLKGAFIYRSSNGSGSVTLTDVQVGVPSISGSFDIKAFAIEMVYIPQGNFVIGDGNGTAENFASFHVGTGNTSVVINTSLLSDVRTAVNANDDNQLEATGIGIDGDNGLDLDDNGSITGSDNPNFPTGYASFYCMKYEISQGAYRDFLNSISFFGQARATNVSPASVAGTAAMGSLLRNYIEIKTAGVNSSTPAVYGLDGDGDNVWDEANDGEWLAANYVSWIALCVYLDWAALRPMTELEFEKICRGSNPSLYFEYAWGTAGSFGSTFSLSNAGQNSETVTNASTSTGNSNNSNTTPGGVVRNGIFATSSSGRTQSGATYYGVMEMSGNVLERVVTVGNVAGRSFRGTLGDGDLPGGGYANVEYWPGINGNSDPTVANSTTIGAGVTQAAGSGFKGGGMDPLTFFGQLVSNRQAAANTDATSTQYYGGRGVR